MRPQDIQTVIVEDDSGYRESLVTMFDYSPGFAVADAFGSARAAVEAAPAVAANGGQWDVIFMDVDLSDHVGGIEAVRRIKEFLPNTAIVMLTVFECPTTILAALCAGADGYVLKRSSARALRDYASEAINGGVPMNAEVARATVGLIRELGAGSSPREPVTPQKPLSNREREVLRLLVDGRTYKEVAQTLGIALDTVRTHVRRLYNKLEVHNAREATAIAVRQGLV